MSCTYRKYELPIDLYRYYIYIVVTSSVANFLPVLKRHKEIHHEFTDAELAELVDSEAFFIAPNNDTCYLFLCGQAGLGDIAHEATHAACHILHSRGVEESYANDEALAYLIGHIADVCGVCIKKFNKQKRISEQ